MIPERHLWELNPLDSVFNLHLQWFAAEDEGRTEDPTETKIKKAREEGKVAKSTELNGSIILLFGLVTIAALSKYMLTQIVEMLHYFFTDLMAKDITQSGIIAPAFYVYFIKISWPVLTVAFVAAFMANLLQVGFVFSLKPITPDFKRIAPNFARFLQKSFASPEAWFNLFKSIFKVALVVFVAYMNIRPRLPMLSNLMHGTFQEGSRYVASVAFLIVVEVAILLLALSIPDYLFQRWQHKESLKMSKQEIKEERKQSEGDPLVKSRLRERYRQIVSQNMMENVPKADVVITNPTHFAIGVQYDSSYMTAPTVTAKGQDNMALKIREIAAEAGVPIMENKPLARALYASVEIGDMVPEEYWEVLSRILAEVYRINGRTA